MDRDPGIWAGLASYWIGDSFDYAKPYIAKDYSGLNPLVRFVVAQLYIDCHLSSESVLLLIREGKVWDADLITRSVMEGSVKFTHLLTGTAEQVYEKVNEYWNVLPVFKRIKHSENAKKLLENIPNPEGPEWQPIWELVISDVEYEQIRMQYNRKDRRALEEKWSFSGIMKSLTKSEPPWITPLVGLMHNYTISSHLVHKDADGVGMVWERNMRDSSRRDAVTIGHAARLVSDICTYANLRLLVLLRACGQETDVVQSLQTKYEELSAALSRANTEFNETEYEKKI